jgi:hypothetical protein
LSVHNFSYNGMNGKVDYLNNPWKPIPHTIFKDAELAQQIHDVGYAVIDFASGSQIEKLQQLYDQEHALPNGEGGMFYSLYSSKIEYRRLVNDTISKVLEPSVKLNFENYREVINTFIAKLPGPKSSFSLHQDTTGLDEHKYSPLSVWLPLNDVTEQNGCMSVIPKSHHFFSPYRGVSFPDPFDGIKNNLAKYLVPVTVKKGQAVIFDPRLVHNSSANMSDKPRIVSLTGLFPESVDFLHCYMDMGQKPTAIEFYKQGDDFLIEYPYLLDNCTERPTVGEIIEKRNYSVEPMKIEEFQQLCQRYDVKPYSNAASELREDCVMIGEPVSV